MSYEDYKLITEELERRVRAADPSASPAAKGGEQFRKVVDGAILFMYVGNQIEIHRVVNGMVEDKYNISIMGACHQIESGGWVKF